MTTVAVLTPLVDLGPTATLGRTVFRKEVLPLDKTISYQGKSLTFDRGLLQSLVDSFKAGAYDAVPFILADAQTNAHNMDPERVRGEVKGLELSGSGLDALVEFPTDWANAHLENNPKLGVSARIVYDLNRADGQHFPAAIQHVLATLDPRVPGMKPWQRVNDLAGDGTPTVDLSATDYAAPVADLDDVPGTEGPSGPDNPDHSPTPEPAPVVIPTTKPDKQEDHMAALTDEEVAQMREDLALMRAYLAQQETPVETDEPEVEMSESELADLFATLDADGTPADAAVEPEMASLSEEHQRAIDLANAQAEDSQNRLAVIEAELAEAKWVAERQRLVGKGVPPAVVDLAKPALATPHAAVVDLSNGTRLDATDLVRKMLVALEGTVDLSGEIGTRAVVIPDEDAAALDAWERQYPL